MVYFRGAAPDTFVNLPAEILVNVSGSLAVSVTSILTFAILKLENASYVIVSFT